MYIVNMYRMNKRKKTKAKKAPAYDILPHHHSLSALLRTRDEEERDIIRLSDTVTAFIPV